MSDKFLTRIAIAAFATLLIAIGAVASLNYFSPAPPKPKVVDVPVVTHVDPIVRSSQTSNPDSDQAMSQPYSADVNLPVANAVVPTNLKGLADSVNLKDTLIGDVNKTAWQKALPQAQKMIDTGACDCEGRNWLIHFVQTGNYAVSGDTHFEDSAKFLNTLPLGDTQGTNHTASN